MRVIRYRSFFLKNIVYFYTIDQIICHFKIVMARKWANYNVRSECHLILRNQHFAELTSTSTPEVALSARQAARALTFYACAAANMW
jgi:hypothetical protein